MKTVTIDGEKVKVGIIGTDTPAIPMFEDPSHFTGVHFADQVPVFKQCVKELKAKGADIIIGITHSGVPR
jgi:2',3'-cyclic-nucleotide 2'-phosphodiesterase/3'-nucleotidase